MVSPKQEYLRRRPETFGDLRLNLGKTGVQRQSRMHEKPEFPTLAERKEWLAGDGSVDRASLRPDSLLTENLQGTLPRWSLRDLPNGQKTLHPSHGGQYQIWTNGRMIRLVDHSSRHCSPLYGAQG
jgi:hypothetical protein